MTRGGVLWEVTSGENHTDSLSPLRWVSLATLLLSSVESIPPKHRHVNPPPPAFKIPRSEWLRIVQQVAQGESLRQIARSYQVSYQAIRRILTAARRSQVQSGEAPLEEEGLDA